MANMFETVILNMQRTGMYQFLLPFMLSMAIFYGLLRRSKIFGEPRETVSINAVVSMVASFMVWSAPILLGINVETGLANFFVQSATATLVIIVGLLITSMFFPPDLANELSKIFKTPKHVSAFLIFGGLVAGAILISSGVITFFLPEGLELGEGGLSDEMVASIVGALLIVGTALVIVWGGGEKKGTE
jgi:hypothetical protein